VSSACSRQDLRSAKMAPIIGSFFKMAVPLIVILPGLIAWRASENSFQRARCSLASTVTTSAATNLARYCGPTDGLGVTRWSRIHGGMR